MIVLSTFEPSIFQIIARCFELSRVQNDNPQRPPHRQPARIFQVYGVNHKRGYQAIKRLSFAGCGVQHFGSMQPHSKRYTAASQQNRFAGCCEADERGYQAGKHQALAVCCVQHFGSSCQLAPNHQQTTSKPPSAVAVSGLHTRRPLLDSNQIAGWLVVCVRTTYRRDNSHQVQIVRHATFQPGQIAGRNAISDSLLLPG